MADAYARFSVTVTTSKLAFVKENKLYRALQGKVTGDGHQLSGTWEDFCSLLGRSREQVDEDIRNLRDLGEEALESMSRMGIGYRELRQYRRLPEDDKTALMEAAKAGDSGAFIDLAEELISKHNKEKATLSKRLDELDGDYSDKAGSEIADVGNLMLSRALGAGTRTPGKNLSTQQTTQTPSGSKLPSGP